MLGESVDTLNRAAPRATSWLTNLWPTGAGGANPKTWEGSYRNDKCQLDVTSQGGNKQKGQHEIKEALIDIFLSKFRSLLNWTASQPIWIMRKSSKNRIKKKYIISTTPPTPLIDMSYKCKCRSKVCYTDGRIIWDWYFSNDPTYAPH